MTKTFEIPKMQIDGYCVLVNPNFDSEWEVAPLSASNEYVFRSWDDAYRFGSDTYDGDHLVSWKVVPHKITDDFGSDFHTIRINPRD